MKIFLCRMNKNKVGINEVENLFEAAREGCFNRLCSLINDFEFSENSLKHALLHFSLQHSSKRADPKCKEILLQAILHCQNRIKTN